MATSAPAVAASQGMEEIGLVPGCSAHCQCGIIGR